MVFSKAVASLALTFAATSLAPVPAAYAQISPASFGPSALLMRGSGHGPGGGHAQGTGYLGIMIRDVTDAEVSTLRLKSAHGAEVTMVDHDGPAGQAGLMLHDVILAANGTPVDDAETLHRILRDLPPGRAVTLSVCRAGTEQTVSATMANRSELERQAKENLWKVPEPADEQAAAAAPARFGAHGFMPGHLFSSNLGHTGARVDALGQQLASHFGVADGKGLLVHEVEGNSPAAIAGLQAGDVVIKVNGGKVATKSDWTRALRDSKGHPVSLTVVRDKQEQTLTMVPDAKHRSAIEPPPPAGEEHSWMTMLLR